MNKAYKLSPTAVARIAQMLTESILHQTDITDALLSMELEPSADGLTPTKAYVSLVAEDHKNKYEQMAFPGFLG